MVRNIFKKKSKKDEKEAESGDIPLEEDKPSRPSVSEREYGEEPEPPAALNISYEETEIIEPEPPQPVFIDPGQNPAFHVETTETVTYHEGEEVPMEHPTDEPKLPASEPRKRSWRPHMPQVHMPKGIQNLSFRKKKEKEAEAMGHGTQPATRQPESQSQWVQPPSYQDSQEMAYRAELESTERFRSTLANINANRIPGYAWGFDYINWKPMGYRRRETHPNEFALYGRALAPYVATVVESGYVGSMERSSILPPPPLVTSRPYATSSQAPSRDPVMGSMY